MATVETVTWYDPFGNATPLKIGLNSQLGDMVGRFMPPVTHIDDVLPFYPGGRHRITLVNEKDFTLPLNVINSSDSGRRTQLRNLVAAMDPTQGAGRISVLSPVGDTREIECYYVGGLDMDENPIKNGRFNQALYVTFRAFEPYWRDPSDTTQSWTVGTPPSFFPIFPMRLSASSLVVNDSINNTGDVISWPVWQIFGPGGGANGIVLTNTLTGQYIMFQTTVLGASESITIDTRPGHKTVLKNDGTNLFPDLDTGSTLWPLQKGTNGLSLVLNNAATSKTAMSVNWRRKWLSP